MLAAEEEVPPPEVVRRILGTELLECDEFAAQRELSKKLNQLTAEEWNRVPLIGLPTRLQLQTFT